MNEGEKDMKALHRAHKQIRDLKQLWDALLVEISINSHMLLPSVRRSGKYDDYNIFDGISHKAYMIYIKQASTSCTQITLCRYCPLYKKPCNASITNTLSRFASYTRSRLGKSDQRDIAYIINKSSEKASAVMSFIHQYNQMTNPNSEDMMRTIHKVIKVSNDTLRDLNMVLYKMEDKYSVLHKKNTSADNIIPFPINKK